MVGYETIEKAVIQQLQKGFTPELDGSLCQASNIDAVFEAMMAANSPYACVVDYMGGSQRTVAPFKEQMWVWEIGGFFWIRHMGDTAETDKMSRDVINRLPLIFHEDRRLGGVTPLATLQAISPPEPTMVNDVPMYWILFSLSIVDK